MTDRQTVAVIGGGAAGLAAAVAAAECGDRVIILERMDRIGKKLLATGNGRCNLMNSGRPRYYGGSDTAELVLAMCGREAQQRFWHEHGLALLEEDEGRVYPATLQAATVLDVLRFTLDKLGVEIRTGVRVTGLARREDAWIVQTDAGDAACDRVIVCGGGKAQPKLGSDGSTYALLQALGHQLVTPGPALTQIVTETGPIRGLAGIRARGEVSVVLGGRRVRRERGEVLFTDYGLSGVCAMQCARWITPKTMLSLNFMPFCGGEDDVMNDLKHRRNLWRNSPAERLLTGLAVPRLAERLAEAAGLSLRDRPAGSLTDEELQRMTRTLLDFRLKPTGVKGFDSAQVTAGGIVPEGFSAFTMESRLAPGVHAAGEVLDVDGDCGGFNLMFAFGSGILAGLNGRESKYRRKIR